MIEVSSHYGVPEWEGNFLVLQAVKFHRLLIKMLLVSWADSPDGPWHRHPEPVLTSGKSGVWKGDKPNRSAILEEDDGWRYLSVFAGI